jgi:hypothetical protein
MTLDDLFQLLPSNTHDQLRNGRIPIPPGTANFLTEQAWNALVAYYQPASIAGHYAYLTKELMALLPIAQVAWHNQASLGILQTDHDFRITKDVHADRLWYVGNKQGGITVMRTNEVPLLFLAR